MKPAIPTLLLAALASAALIAAPTPADAKRPNILLILADDLGYGELGCQGNPEIPTPHIDSLANHGVRFTSGYVSGPYCSPTRAALMTGRYQQRYGHEFNGGPAQNASAVFGLSLKETTLGDRLKAAGYATGWFGKSHLGYEPQFHPLRRGFDEYFGFLGGAHSYLDAASDSNNPILRGTNRVTTIDYTTDAFGREAVSFIERHKDRPWFVYLPFNAVHGPLEATEKYLSRFPNLKEPKRRAFAAMLSAMDDAVGTVLAKIRQLGLEENTLVFFLSDNGGPTAQTTSGNGPLRGFKAQTWEGGIRVPWIVQWKGHIPAGKVEHRPVIQLDIHPTALAAAGIPIRPEWKLDGADLLPYLLGQKTGTPHEILYWRFGQQIALRKGDWKLVKGAGSAGLTGGNRSADAKASTDGAELYNLAQDLGEKTDLADKAPDKLKELTAAWNVWNSELVDPAWRPAAAPRRTTGGRGENALASNASRNGPWQAGDTLNRADAPQVANRPFIVTAQVAPAAPNGVILAQGGTANGYALYLKNGRLTFAVRIARQLTTVTATNPLEPGRSTVEARLAADGRISLSVSGRQVAEGRAPGLIPSQPARGLSVGSDGGPVGDYPAPNRFAGTLQDVTLRFP
ncbi:MAG TPA: sulfatase-like hydrolase/transferase [Verrucomicrobiota bacterium]|nr:sulfatase-like hydrolase/transferase [Verrucomicrobiota bacterium]HNU52269.1 sulfatase-like hydrolase/transferase [Verrucomicrobiota bacterium]